MRKDRTEWLWGQHTSGKVQLWLEEALSWCSRGFFTSRRHSAFLTRCRVRRALQRVRRPALRFAGACLYFGTLVLAAKLLWAPLAVLTSYGVVLAAFRCTTQEHGPWCRVSTAAAASAGVCIVISPTWGAVVGAVAWLCPEQYLWWAPKRKPAHDAAPSSPAP